MVRSRTPHGTARVGGGLTVVGWRWGGGGWGAECREMVAELSKLEVIAVDCEGVNLSREGELCLVQIGTESKVYLVDVLEHGRALFEEGGLRALLESAKVRKVLHDCRYGRRPPPPGPTGASVNSQRLAMCCVLRECRGDSDAMYHQYGVALQNVFDTQIAYAVIKRQMGQGYTHAHAPPHTHHRTRARTHSSWL